jgi:rhamnosyltransferase
VCDSINIQKYIFTAYPKFSQKNSAFIPYGAELTPSTCSAEVFQKWLDKTGTSCRAFYLVVGRFVPENNFEVVIREFMQSATKKDLIIITNVEKNKFYKYLQKKLGFEKDGRIKFVGTVYDQNLLAKIRENAFAYIHGHSVGGTNPSLLEALGHTELNLLFDVPFNREVAGAEALYFSDRSGDLTNLIKNVEAKPFVLNPKSVIATRYSWAFVISSYEALFVSFFQAPAANIGI